jgi:DNA-binding transcriptional LysR family regulator
MLDVRKLRLLRELHARGTVAAVAEAVAYTPSAVSQQLAQLQAEAGVALTERVGRRLRLTEAGLRLVGHAEALLAQLEEAEADLQAASGAVRGTIRVASLQTPLISLVPVAHRLLRERHPELRLELREMEPEDALPAVSLGELDAAVAEEYDFAPRPVVANLVKEELGADEVVVALPPDHPAARSGGPVALADLAGQPWVSAYGETRFAQMSERACRLAGFEPDVHHRCNDALIMLALVAGGSGVALVPRAGPAGPAPRRGRQARGRLRPAAHDLRLHAPGRTPAAGARGAGRRPARGRRRAPHRAWLPPSRPRAAWAMRPAASVPATPTRIVRKIEGRGPSGAGRRGP